VDLELNADNVESGELVLGRWIRQDSTFIPTMVAPNAVKVWRAALGPAGHDAQTQAGVRPLFGTNEVSTARDSIAVSIASTGAGIICLSSDPKQYVTVYKHRGTTKRAPASSAMVAATLTCADLATGWATFR